MMGRAQIKICPVAVLDVIEVLLAVGTVTNSLWHALMGHANVLSF